MFIGCIYFGNVLPTLHQNMRIRAETNPLETQGTRFPKNHLVYFIFVFICFFISEFFFLKNPDDNMALKCTEWV